MDFLLNKIRGTMVSRIYQEAIESGGKDRRLDDVPKIFTRAHQSMLND